MLTHIIQTRLRWPLLVLLTTTLLVAIGFQSMLKTPIDAIPDLSDVQVIVGEMIKPEDLDPVGFIVLQLIFVG